MAGVLPQTNATLLEVKKAAPLSDSFVSDSFGSGEEAPEEETLWEGKVGIWIPPIRKSRESSSDGRDEISERTVITPFVCQIEIGDKLELDLGDQTQTWKVSGATLIGHGLELKSSQVYELIIEVI